MLLIIYPTKKWRREIVAFSFENATAADRFQAFQLLNETLEDEGVRADYNVTLAPVTPEQFEDWIDNNVEPTWWELLTRRFRYSITHMRKL